MTSLLGRLLFIIEKQWENTRQFAFNNRTIFESFFIAVYAVIQILLIILAFCYPKYISLFVSLFAVLVLSTFALHKLLMESRIKILEEMVADLNFEKQRITLDARDIYDRYNEIIKYFNEVKTKGLYKYNPKLNRKRLK